MAKERVLITGGAGYIGSYVNKLLAENGYETCVLDNLSRGNRAAVSTPHFVLGDIGDQKLLSNLLSSNNFDACLHFAALTDVGESVRDPQLTYENNVTKSITLFDTLINHGVKNIIFSSSAAIFGAPEEKIINEMHPKVPINPYGKSKLIVEQILEDYHHAYSLNSCSLRYFNAAGGDPSGKIALSHKLTNVLPVILRSIKKDEPFPLFGNDYDTYDGTCVRDYIHIHDLATAHLLALEKLLKKPGYYTYNLGNGRGFSLLEVVEAAKKATGQTIRYQIAPRRPGDPPFLVADATKAKQDLCWTPQYPSMERIIEDAYRVSLSA